MIWSVNILSFILKDQEEVDYDFIYILVDFQINLINDK
jgi:hypothetical protein